MSGGGDCVGTTEAQDIRTSAPAFHMIGRDTVHRMLCNYLVTCSGV